MVYPFNCIEALNVNSFPVVILLTPIVTFKILAFISNKIDHAKRVEAVRSIGPENV